jgi:hypothetical protein
LRKESEEGEPPTETGSVTGRVWQDGDSDGIQGEDEIGQGDVEVTLTSSDYETIVSLTTDADGYFTFAGVVVGEYFLTFELLPDFKFSPQHQGNDAASDSDPYPDTGETDLFQIETVGQDVQLDAGLTGESGLTGVDHEDPPVTTDFELELADVIAGACDYPLPGGVGTAVLLGSENGFILQLYNPLGMGIRGDGEGGLFAAYNGPKSAGFGETGPRELEIFDFKLESSVISILISETLFREEYPEGCTRNYTLVYTFADKTVLDFLRTIPSGGVEDVGIDNPHVDFGEDTITITGTITNMKPGQICHVWVEVSGSEIDYYMVEIVPDANGTFEVIIEEEIPPGTFMMIHILCNGRITANTSGNSPSE